MSSTLAKVCQETKRVRPDTYVLHSGCGWSKGRHEQFWGDFCASRAAASLLQLQITNWDIFRISTKPTSFRTLCFLSTWPRWWQAPRICNNERIGKNDENLWLFVVGIIWAGLACFPASKETPFKYLTTGLKGVNFVLEINSSPPLSQISVNTWAGQWSANRLHWDWPALPFSDSTLVARGRT